MAKPSAPSGADKVVSVLQSHGVKFIFNLCGDSVSSLIVAADKAGIQIIGTRNEATCVFAAKAYARITGIPGVVTVTMGPGTANTILGALEANFDEVPLLILSGGIPTKYHGIGYVQDMDQVGLMRIPCKASMTIPSKGQVVETMRTAFHTALSGVPGPVYVEMPVDILVNNYTFHPRPYLRDLELAEGGNESAPISTLGMENDPKKGEDVSPKKITIAKATEDDIKMSVALIKAAKRPVIIIGSQAVLQVSKIGKTAEAVKALGIPTFTTFASKGLMGKSHKYLLAQDTLIKKVCPDPNADLVIMAGVKPDFSTVRHGEDLPKSGAVISVNRDEKIATLNEGIYWRKAQIVVSDAGYYLRQLSEALRKINYSSPETWITSLRKSENDYEAYLQKKASEPSNVHLNPLRVLSALESTQRGKNVLWVMDTGDFTHAANYFIKPESPLSWIESGPFAGVGGGMGYAIGAKLANPGREVWSIVGDGSCGYTITEFDTLHRFKLNIAAICGNDGRWGEIYRKQIEVYGTGVGCSLLANPQSPYTDYEEVVKPFGGVGFRVDEFNGFLLDGILGKASEASKSRSVFVNTLIGTTDLLTGHLRDIPDEEPAE